eukprot:Nitzschia sp. Nitz4//scaffold162_size51285//31375//32697//NITZ4_006972-RA/size51285-processed-gene-0.35-mRNA-1//1//CDS//3329537982//5647//frame0
MSSTESLGPIPLDHQPSPVQSSFIHEDGFTVVDDNTIVCDQVPFVAWADEIEVALAEASAILTRANRNHSIMTTEEDGNVLENHMQQSRQLRLSSSSRDYATQQRNRLRFLILSVLVSVVVLAVVLSSRFNNSNNNNAATSNQVQEGPLDNQTSTPTTVVPTFEPTSAPTYSFQQSLEFQVLRPYVNASQLADLSTPQGQAYQQILLEDWTTDPDFGFRIHQRFLMMVLYFSMGGSSWDWHIGWSDFERDECEWFGVSLCRSRNGRRVVAGLQLSSNHLTGTIPTELCLLTNLETVRLAENQLVGTLPDCLMGLESMFEFVVQNNDLSGTPPGGWLQLSRLEVLDLADNDFTGDLSFLSGTSDEVAAASLSQLYLDHNSFGGTVPEVLLELSELTEVTFHKNAVKGDVTSLCDNESVISISADCNQLECSNSTCCDCYAS